MLDPGDPAPDFDLQGTADGGTAAYRLSAATNRAPVVVAFAPGSDPGSRALLAELAETDWADVANAVAVLGILPASLADCQSLAASLSLPYPLLSDTAGVAAQFGAERPGGAVRRAAFVVDRRCRVSAATAFAASERAPELAPLLRAVAAL